MSVCKAVSLTLVFLIQCPLKTCFFKAGGTTKSFVGGGMECISNSTQLIQPAKI